MDLVIIFKHLLFTQTVRCSNTYMKHFQMSNQGAQNDESINVIQIAGPFFAYMLRWLKSLALKLVSDLS